MKNITKKVHLCSPEKNLSLNTRGLQADELLPAQVNFSEFSKGWQCTFYKAGIKKAQGLPVLVTLALCYSFCEALNITHACQRYAAGPSSLYTGKSKGSHYVQLTVRNAAKYWNGNYYGKGW